MVLSAKAFKGVTKRTCRHPPVQGGQFHFPAKVYPVVIIIMTCMVENHEVMTSIKNIDVTAKYYINSLVRKNEIITQSI